MSKMDNLRAMREARYAEMTKRSGPETSQAKAAAKKRPPVAPPPVSSAPKTSTASSAESPVADSSVAETAAGPALCGHRNMSGRTCTREHGHAAKSHRYS